LMVCLLGVTDLSAFSAAASVSSCGQAGDHISNVIVSISPDPLHEGEAFTFTFEGDLDESLGEEVNVNIDVEVSLFGLIKKTVKKVGNVVASPLIPAGRVSLKVGPVSVNTRIRGSVYLKGKVELTDKNHEPVACVALDLNVPAAEAEYEYSPGGSVENCGSASDHAKDLVVKQDAQGKLTMTGNLDEQLSEFSVKGSLEIKELFVHIPLSFNAPVVYSPGFFKGPFRIETTLLENQEESLRGLGLEIKGSGRMLDKNGEEVGCLEFDEFEATREMVV